MNGWMGRMGAASPAPPKPPGQARAAPLLGHRSSQAIAQRRARSVDQQATISAVPSAPSHAFACLLSFTYKLSNVNQRDNSHVSLPPTTPNLGGTSLSPSAIFLLAKMPHQSVEYRTVLGGSPSWGMSIVWANGTGSREVQPAMAHESQPLASRAIHSEATIFGTTHAGGPGRSSGASNAPSTAGRLD